MTPVTQQFSNSQKRSKMQRRRSRWGRRTSRRHLIPKKIIKRHKRNCLSNGVEETLPDIPMGECPKSTPDYFHLQDENSANNIPEEMFENVYYGPEVGIMHDTNFMDYNYTNINESCTVGMPFVPHRCQQCGGVTSNIINKECILGLKPLFWSGNLFVWDILARSAIIVNLGYLDYQNACESTIGYSSDGTRPEAVFDVLDHGLSIRCGLCECLSYIPDGNAGAMDRSPNFTPDYSSRPSFSFLPDQHTANTAMCMDEFLTNRNETQHFSLEAQPQVWPKQHDQKVTDELRRDIPNDQNETNQRANVQTPCDASQAEMTSPTSTVLESQTPIQSPEEPKYEKCLESGNRQLTASAQPKSDQSITPKKWWACLWYKKDSLRYHECSKYKLQRIKDVKQHTWRKHMKPVIYCPVCFELFASPKERDEHVQKKSCSPRERPEFDGISEEQRKELNHNANRGRNDMEQWYYMWNAIFPGACRPQSPYIGNSWEKILPLLRNFWNKSQPEILSEALQVPLTGCQLQDIQRVVDKIFDLFEAEPSYLGTIPDVSPEIVPSKIKHEEVTQFGTLDSMAPSDMTHLQWDLYPEPQIPSLEQQVLLKPDSNLEDVKVNFVKDPELRLCV
ncbi:hypothetical protein F4805DRAFT_410094 [Annulohypoxylon moriforme]|nr:hypothetical protein F4805DRAFT_410094 [Annulohypoxylon moriforme]